MFEKLLVCLDGSASAEKIIPLACGISQATKGKLVFLRVVQDPAESWTEEECLNDCARQYGAQLRIAVSPDPSRAIRAELVREPRAIAALTTHGRTAWTEAIMGSVALGVLRGAMRPVLLFKQQLNREAPKKITTVAAALDGSAFSEKILSYAIRAARSLSARLLLLRRCRCGCGQSYLTKKQRISWNRLTCIEKPPKSKPIKESRRNGKCCMANQAMRSVVTSKTCQKRCSQWRPMHAPVRSDS